MGPSGDEAPSTPLNTEPAEPGQIITFYSYKGGTGRTMALANVACLLARALAGKRRVLAIDWDLEAPGLHRYFADRVRRAFGESSSRELAFRRKRGLIDLFELLRSRTEALDSNFEEPPPGVIEDLDASVDLNDFLIATDIPNLDLMKAGCFDENYAKKVNTFPWEPLYRRVPWLIPFFTDRITARYSWVLVDSRTGITDTSGICTMLLPDKLVVVFTPNAQSLEGVLEMTERAATYRRNSTVRPLGVFPLASRIEGNEPQQFQRWRKGANGYQPEFENLFQRIWSLPSCNLELYFDEAQVQHVASYAYGEKVAALTELDDNRTGLKRAYMVFTEKLSTLDDAWDDVPEKPRPDPEAAAAADAAAVYAALTPELQEAARELFLGLVRLVQGEARTIGTLSELSPKMREAAESFVHKRTLVESGGALSCSSERLPSRWEQLNDWIKAELPFLTWRSILAPLAASWEHNDRNPSELLRGSRLADSEGYFLRYGRLLDHSEADYIRASREARLESEQSGRRRRRMVQVGVMLFSFAAAFGIFEFWQTSQSARSNRLRAAKMNSAANKISQAGQIEVMVLLAAESERVFPSPDAELTLMELLPLLPKRTAYYPNAGKVTRIRISPDSRTFAAANDDEVFIAPLAGGTLSRVATKGPIGPIEFSPLGNLAVAESNAISLDLHGRRAPVVQLGSPATALAFSGDGHHLATGIRAGTVNVWSIPDFRVAATIKLQTPIFSLAFSPDGQLVAAGTSNGAQVWPFANAGKEFSLGYRSSVTQVAYSPDGKYLVAAGETASLWGSGPNPQAFGDVTSSGPVGFSPDSKFLARKGSPLQVYSVPALRVVLKKADARGLGVVTADSKYVAGVELGGDAKDAVQLWLINDATASDPVRVFPLGSPPTVMAFSRNGQYAITGSEDGSLASWLLLPVKVQGRSGPQLVNMVCDAVWKNLTQAQWQQYLPDEPYRKTCPALP